MSMWNWFLNELIIGSKQQVFLSEAFKMTYQLILRFPEGKSQYDDDFVKDFPKIYDLIEQADVLKINPTMAFDSIGDLGFFFEHYDKVVMAATLIAETYFKEGRQLILKNSEETFIANNIDEIREMAKISRNKKNSE